MPMKKRSDSCLESQKPEQQQDEVVKSINTLYRLIRRHKKIINKNQNE
jgi:hypothetical protein